MSLAWACAIMLAAATAHAQEPAPDRSLDRMRSVLAHKPLILDAPDITPTFKIEIKAIHPMHDIFEKPPWQLPPILWRIPSMGPATAFGSMPLLNVDLLSIARSVDGAKRAHNERLAREEVQRSIADYCAVQPNPNLIQICSTARGSR
jgi:hypothetical protein